MLLKKTLIVGASINEEKFSNKAIKLLRKHDFPVYAFGSSAGTVADVEISTVFPNILDIDTVSLYIAPKNQSAFYNDIIDLCPKRVIFNPGTENREFFQLLKDEHIEVVENCTLVMLNFGIY